MNIEPWSRYHHCSPLPRWCDTAQAHWVYQSAYISPSITVKRGAAFFVTDTPTQSQNCVHPCMATHGRNVQKFLRCMLYSNENRSLWTRPVDHPAASGCMFRKAWAHVCDLRRFHLNIDRDSGIHRHLHNAPRRMHNSIWTNDQSKRDLERKWKLVLTRDTKSVCTHAWAYPHNRRKNIMPSLKWANFQFFASPSPGMDADLLIEKLMAAVIRLGVWHARINRWDRNMACSVPKQLRCAGLSVVHMRGVHCSLRYRTEPSSLRPSST